MAHCKKVRLYTHANKVLCQLLQHYRVTYIDAFLVSLKIRKQHKRRGQGSKTETRELLEGTKEKKMLQKAHRKNWVSGQTLTRAARKSPHRFTSTRRPIWLETWGPPPTLLPLPAFLCSRNMSRLDPCPLFMTSWGPRVDLSRCQVRSVTQIYFVCILTTEGSRCDLCGKCSKHTQKLRQQTRDLRAV